MWLKCIVDGRDIRIYTDLPIYFLGSCKNEPKAI